MVQAVLEQLGKLRLQLAPLEHNEGNGIVWRTAPHMYRRRLYLEVRCNNRQMLAEVVSTLQSEHNITLNAGGVWVPIARHGLRYRALVKKK